MKRIEQITAIILAATLAIPSYWLFWTLAGGGGYNRRNQQDSSQKAIDFHYNPPLAFRIHNLVSSSSILER